MVKALGISLLKATIASNLVQCVGTMWSGFIVMISATANTKPNEGSLVGQKYGQRIWSFGGKFINTHLKETWIDCYSCG